MILKSLYDYYWENADTFPPLGLEDKEFEFVIVIDESGRFIRFESHRIDKKRCETKRVAKAVARTSAPMSNTLWDNVKYVLGINDTKNCNELFVDRVRQVYNANPDDKSLKAILSFYDVPADERMKLMSRDPLFEDVKKSISNLTFRLESDQTSVAEKSEIFVDWLNANELNALDVQGPCLVSGEGNAHLVRVFTSTSIPGSSATASLVSFQTNQGYDSYGKSQVYNAPISYEADFAISTALKKLLGKDSENKLNIGNRMLLFWGSGNRTLSKEVDECAFSIFAYLDPKKENPNARISKVVDLFKGIFSGEIKTTLDDRFHMIGLAPNAGRIAVVSFVECELKEFASRILAHFSDMEIHDFRKPENRRPYYGVYSMVSAVTLGGKPSDALPNLIEDTIAAIANSTPYPFRLYSSAIERIRAELTDSGVSIQRAAILKAYLNRHNKTTNNHKKLEIMLDKNNDNPGYLCGRLAALLEKIQEDAKSGDSIRTRYMASASSTPAAVFPAMLNLSVHHSEKLSEGSRIYFEQQKQEVMDKMPVDGFPAHLDLNDQGRFFVGYYHQRADLFTKKDKE